MSCKKGIFSVIILLLLLSGCRSEESVFTDPVPVNTYEAENFVEEGGFLHYQGEDSAYVGVDVSSFQGEIDWNRVAEAGVQFAIIRAGYRGYTEGGLYEDDFFRDNVEGALEAGLDVGVYFFSQAVSEEEAVEEAEYLLSLIQDYPITYPVAFDWEKQNVSSSRTRFITGSTITACATAFCQTIEEAGYLPMVYFNPVSGYLQLDLEQFLDWPFWLANYTEDWEATSFRYHYEIWQYASDGTVDGIEGNVDLNLCLTDFSVWETSQEKIE